VFRIGSLVHRQCLHSYLPRLPGRVVRSGCLAVSNARVFDPGHRYATSPVPVDELVVADRKTQGRHRNGGVADSRRRAHHLFDSGFHRDTHLKEFPMRDYLRPDEAVKTAECSRRT